MQKIPNRLWDAIVVVCGMSHPTVAQILRKRGFGYEADRMDELTTAFEEANLRIKERTDARQRARRSH